MTYANERDSTSDDFTDWFDSIESNADDEDEESNEKVKQFLDELEEDTLHNS